MKGSIDYLRKVRDICQEHKGDCKRCPLGERRILTENICPRLTNPMSWDDDKITTMVKVERI